MEPIDTLIVRGQQDFELHDQLTDDTFIKRLKNIKAQRINLHM